MFISKIMQNGTISSCYHDCYHNNADFLLLLSINKGKPSEILYFLPLFAIDSLILFLALCSSFLFFSLSDLFISLYPVFFPVEQPRHLTYTDDIELLFASLNRDKVNPVSAGEFMLYVLYF
jgi:hypothetical protein